MLTASIVIYRLSTTTRTTPQVCSIFRNHSQLSPLYTTTFSPPYSPHSLKTTPTPFHNPQISPRPKQNARPTFSLSKRQYHWSSADFEEGTRIFTSSLTLGDINVDGTEKTRNEQKVTAGDCVPDQYPPTDWYKRYPIPTITTAPLTHTFHSAALEARVFTHKSLARVGANDLDNEGLEWLGDRILKTFLGILLFKNDPSLSEGEYTEIMGALENNEFFAHLSEIYGLKDRLIVGSNTSVTDIRKSTTVLGGLFEAYVGGVYLDRVGKTDEATALHDMIGWLTPVFEPYMAIYRGYHQEHKLANGFSKLEVVSPIMTKVKDLVRRKGFAEIELTTKQLTTPLLGPGGITIVAPWQAELVVGDKVYRGVDAKKKGAVNMAYTCAWKKLTGLDS